MFNKIIFFIFMLIFTNTNPSLAFENKSPSGLVCFHGIYKAIGFRGIDLKTNAIELIAPHENTKYCLLLLPLKKQLMFKDYSLKRSRVIFSSLKNHSTTQIIDLAEYYGPYAVAKSLDDEIVIFACIGIKERTYFQPKISNLTGRPNYNKSTLFYVDLENDGKIRTLNIPYIKSNLALSPDKKKFAFDYLKLDKKNGLTIDNEETIVSGTGVIAFADIHNISFFEDISFYKWAPDGKHVSYIKNSKLCIKNTINQNKIKVKIPGEVLQYDWSPDSDYIVLQYLKGYYGILSKTILINIKTKKIKTLLDSNQFLTDRRHLTNIQWISRD